MLSKNLYQWLLSLDKDLFPFISQTIVIVQQFKTVLSYFQVNLQFRHRDTADIQTEGKVLIHLQVYDPGLQNWKLSQCFLRDLQYRCFMHIF